MNNYGNFDSHKNKVETAVKENFFSNENEDDVLEEIADMYNDGEFIDEFEEYDFDEEEYDEYEELKRLLNADAGTLPFPLDDFYEEKKAAEEKRIKEEEKMKEQAKKTAEITEDFNNAEFIFASGVSRTLNDFESRLNNNIIVAGTSGCGKTTSFIEPNLCAPHGSYIISDPKGMLEKKYKRLLENKGYKVYCIDFQNPEKGLRWNPLMNIHRTQDITRIAHMICFDPRSSYGSDPFWDNANILYISAIIGYMIETNHSPLSFDEIMRFMGEGGRHTVRDKARGIYNDKASDLADRFEALHERDPQSWAYEQFNSVNTAADKTYDSIRITLASKFANFTSRELRQMMSGNDIDFEKIAQEKTVVFIKQNDCDRSLDGLVNLFISQMMYSLIRYADSFMDGRLPIPVRFFLDDYGATTAIDGLDTIISTIRSRAISVQLILQSESQLVASSKDGAMTTVLANCDTYIYMGGNDISTATEVSKRCNKPLEDVLYMPVGYCWVFERGKKPIYAKISPRPDPYVPEKIKTVDCMEK